MKPIDKLRSEFTDKSAHYQNSTCCN